MSIENKAELLNEAQAAQALGIDKSTLCRLRQKGAIGFYRIGAQTGGRVVYSTRHVRDFLARSEHRPVRSAQEGN